VVLHGESRKAFVSSLSFSNLDRNLRCRHSTDAEAVFLGLSDWKKNPNLALLTVSCEDNGYFTCQTLKFSNKLPSLACYKSGTFQFISNEKKPWDAADMTRFVDKCAAA